MKVHDIISETVSSGGFGAGSIATHATSMGKTKRRKDSIFAGKKTKADADEQQLNDDQVPNKIIRRSP